MADVSRYDAATRLIHLLLALLGIAALISGQFADDYRRAIHTGFDVHRWIGLAMALAVAVRLTRGVTLPRLRLCVADVADLARLRLPMREGHEGLAGLIQAVGLGAFAWMAATGVVMWIYLEPGTRATGWLRAVKELHEGGQVVAIAYVVMHVGAVIVHSAAGHPIWRRMA